jgi:2,6-dihydroxypyridine 3-monooxygenase
MRRPIEKIIVIGGSHAGLFSAVALRNAGFDVDVYERATELLTGYGAGIRVQPRLAELLWKEAGIDMGKASTRTRYDRHLAPRSKASGNTVVFEKLEDGQFASWGSLYGALIGNFGRERYHCGEACVGTTERDGVVEVRFESGRVETADLVVFADGISSTGRRRLMPPAGLKYSGYVAWRALVVEDTLSRETREVLRDARIFVIPGLSHVILYPVPGEVPGSTPRINCIWYRNVAEGADLDELMTDREGFHRPTTLRSGQVQQSRIDAFRRDVAESLPPAVVEVLLKPEPWVTPIYDVEPSRMVFGRQVLVGDAAAGTRPHVSASTARGLRAAFGLADKLKALTSRAGVAEALDAWEREHLDIAWEFTRRGREIGRKLQVDGTFIPGAPENSQITMPAEG